jgi:hypothetical protein
LLGFGSFNNENDDAVARIDVSSIEAGCLELGGHQIGDVVATGQALSGHRPNFASAWRLVAIAFLD